MPPSSPGPRTGVAILGGAMAAAALVMMAGWLFEIEHVVGAFAGFLMVFNTALCFAVAGTALAAGALLPARRSFIHSGAGITLATLGSLVLAEHLLGVDLGIDGPGLHGWLVDAGRNPHPGRTSVATSITIVLAGSAFVLSSHVRTAVQASLARTLTFAVGFVGVLAVAGDVLKLVELMDSYVLTQVSLPTALGFVALALVLRMSWQHEPWAKRPMVEREDDRIALAGAAILAASIAIAGIAIFAVMKAGMERMLSANLAYALKAHNDAIAGAIGRSIRTTSAIVHRPTLRKRYIALAGQPADAEGATYYQMVADSMLREDFVAFAFHDAEGRVIARAGEFVAASALRMPLAHVSTPAELQWDGGFVLLMRVDVVEGGVRFGDVRVQMRLKEMDTAVADTSELGTTGELAVCARSANTLHCAPTRLRPAPFDVAIQPGPRLPMTFALAGETGVRKLTDYRAKTVLAAYAPIGTYGIGAVLKSDLEDLYAPIGTRLGYLVLILLGASLGGGWLLRNRVRPLARGLLRGKEQLRLALEGSQLSMWDLDLSTGNVHLDERWSAMLGGTPQPTDSTAVAMLALAHPDDVEMIRTNVTSLLRGTSSNYDIEHRVRTITGAWIWIRSRGQVVERLPGGRASRAIGTNVDVSERKQLRMDSDHRANHDALTGLPNRSLFDDRLERALLHGHRTGAMYALMYIDVDHFKRINDTRGHAAGDAVLKEFAARLLKCVRSVDTVARLGGDEFAVILERLGAREDGQRVANKIVMAMRPAFGVEGEPLYLSASVGIAFHEGMLAVAPKDLIDAADRALYEAKSGGRDGWRAAA